MRYWVPNFIIINPEELQMELEKELLGYIEK